MQNTVYEVDVRYQFPTWKAGHGMHVSHYYPCLLFKTQIIGKPVMTIVEKCLYLHLQLLNNDVIFHASQIIPMKYITWKSGCGRRVSSFFFITRNSLFKLQIYDDYVMRQGKR